MNTELLERLSKAAPEWMRIERSRFMDREIDIFRVRKGDEVLFSCARSTKELDRLDRITLFDAICEKIKAMGWTWTREPDYYTIHTPSGDEFTHGIGGGLDITALSLALCEALEAELPNCDTCGGNGIDPMQQPDAHRCPSCQGIGKQQEVEG